MRAGWITSIFTNSQSLQIKISALSLSWGRGNAEGTMHQVLAEWSETVSWVLQGAVRTVGCPASVSDPGNTRVLHRGSRLFEESQSNLEAKELSFVLLLFSPKKARFWRPQQEGSLLCQSVSQNFVPYNMDVNKELWLFSPLPACSQSSNTTLAMSANTFHTKSCFLAVHWPLTALLHIPTEKIKPLSAAGINAQDGNVHFSSSFPFLLPSGFGKHDRWHLRKPWWIQGLL